MKGDRDEPGKVVLEGERERERGREREGGREREREGERGREREGERGTEREGEREREREREGVGLSVCVKLKQMKENKFKV